MSRAPVFIEVKDNAGNVVTGASVTIYNRASGLMPTIYSGETGTGTQSNPMTVDAFGRVTGWVDRGEYLAKVQGTGIVTYTIPLDAAPAGDRDIDTAWVPRTLDPTIVTALTGTTPTGPADGERFIWAPALTNVSPVEFRYNAASSFAYKWEAVGGQGMTETGGGVVTYTATGGVWYDLNQLSPAMTLSFTVPFTGDYDLYAHLSASNLTLPVHQYVGLSINAAVPTYQTLATTAAAGFYMQTAGRWRASLTAGQVLRIYGLTSGTGSWAILSRGWAIQPIRVL